MDDGGPNEPTDRDLIERWRAGDKRAAQYLIRRHYPSIKRFFINAVGDQEAMELTQDTFAKLARKHHDFEYRSAFKTYLFTIARRTLYDFFKKKHRGQFSPLEHSVVDIEAVRPSELVSRLRRGDVLLDHLRKLPVEHKQLLELFYWHRLTANDLGEIFDANPNTIKSWIADIKKKLAQAVRQSDRPLVSDTDLEDRLRQLGDLFEQGPRAEP